MASTHPTSKEAGDVVFCVAKPSEPPARTRSLGGCVTCRSRHIKCDEGRPSCLACQNNGLDCQGYEIRLVFDSSDSYGSRCRRPLFTEHMRQKMSTQLIDSVGPEHVNQVLMQVDGECEEPEQETGIDFTTRRGPFGAFRMLHGKPADAPPRTSTSPVNNTCDAVLNLEEIENLFSHDPLMDCLFWDVGALEDIPAGNFFNSTFSSPLANPDLNMLMGTSRPVDSSSLPIQSFVQPQNLAPEDGPFLLLYYKNTVIELFSPIRFEKTPWHILHVPNAMETLARLTMGELPGNARLSILYAILATSAFVQRMSPSQGSCQYWQNQADIYTVQAQAYLKLALQDASAVPKKVKYKDILIALLCMLTISAYQGSEERIRRCLLDCENWIRFRGLPKTPKSRKVRLLHHCYVYLRIFHESTSISPLMLHDIDEGQSSQPSVTSLTSSRSFRLREWEGRLDQRMSEFKEPRQGENDLFLDIPGRWDPTMYPLIYGIPESLLFLLSQVTRLGNERDLACSDHCEGVLDFRQFSTRARNLEKCICAWRPPALAILSQDDDLNDQRSVQSNSRLIQHMLAALHKALVIFFYRRIYDVDATMLQDKVWQIRDSLIECDRENDPAARIGTGFLWAAFIAACEALDSTLQDWFTKWFDVSAARSGLRNFKIARDTAQQVWERQRRPLNSNISTSWPQVLRESNLSLFYV